MKENGDINESEERRAGLTEPQTHRSSRRASPRLCVFPPHSPKVAARNAAAAAAPRAAPRAAASPAAESLTLALHHGTLERPLHATGGPQSSCTKLRRQFQLYATQLWTVFTPSPPSRSLVAAHR